MFSFFIWISFRGGLCDSKGKLGYLNEKCYCFGSVRRRYRNICKIWFGFKKNNVIIF